MAHSSREYQRDYMRRYRETMRELQGHAAQVAFWSGVALRDIIVSLIREKYNPDDYKLHTVFDATIELVKKHCPLNTPEEQERIVDVHMLTYYRTGMLSDIFASIAHPSLNPDLLDPKKLGKRIEELEKEVKKNE